MHTLLVAAMTLVASMLLASPASADTFGEVGTVAAVQINTSEADTYLQFHGKLSVRNADKLIDEYRWGGTSCGSRLLTEAEVAALQRALDNKKARIQPIYQDGQGQTLCLVGFNIVNKSFLKLVLPQP